MEYAVRDTIELAKLFWWRDQVMPRKRIFQKIIIYTMIFVLVVGTFLAGAASFI
ncbi:hypothetical protein JCM19038_265 [Geomicrobium sp. JCM 19038]|nr:hypothetical protein JCM19055_1599 [Geomicrobium sp. JCM 19055]GAK06563.1 hypothetical protein JCM19038_265 [Geomicrobium sp. JCM 19038]